MAKDFLIYIALIGGLVGGFFTARWIYDRPGPGTVTPPDEIISVPAVLDSTDKPTDLVIKKPRIKYYDVPTPNPVLYDSLIVVYDTLHIPAGAPYAEDKITVLSPAKVTTRYWIDKQLFSHSISYLPTTPAPAPIDNTRKWTIGMMLNGGYPQYAGAGLYYHRHDRGLLIGVDGGFRHWGVMVGVDLLRSKVK